MKKSNFSCNTSNTRRCVSSDIQTPNFLNDLEVVQINKKKKISAAPRFFNLLLSVWISDETHFRVFEIASQMINNAWRNSRLKLANFYGNSSSETQGQLVGSRDFRGRKFTVPFFRPRKSLLPD